MRKKLLQLGMYKIICRILKLMMLNNLSQTMLILEFSLILQIICFDGFGVGWTKLNFRVETEKTIEICNGNLVLLAIVYSPALKVSLLLALSRVVDGPTIKQFVSNISKNIMKLGSYDMGC
ncbi:hypothetical protein VNO77_01934 [Canavalia gladiata]|uniref:Uncharacterized protein n=1 Tax=Canavalia gladiata TaxID=3824 RepID=A0AAN9MS26_CANGL